MTLPFYIEISAFCILALATMLLSRRNRQIGSLLQNIFDRILIWTMLILAVDAVMWCFDGVSLRVSRELSLLGNSVYYLLQLAPGFLWVQYCDYSINRDEAAMKKRRRAYLIPVLAGIILVIINLNTGWLFSVSSKGVYSRGPLVVLYALISFADVATATIMCISKASTCDIETRRDLENLALFAVPPVVGTIIQFLFYGITVIWPCLVLSLLFVFISSLNGQISTDELTGINNRRRLNRFLSAQVHSTESGRRLYAIIVDIDDFKRINDIYGHAEGDHALVLAAATLKTCCAARNCFLARIGGDEFAIVLTADNDESVVEFTELIRRRFLRLFVDEEIGYILTVSLGFDWIDPSLCRDYNLLLTSADKKMYADKALKKA